MKLINKIKAIFNFHGQQIQVDVLSARIKNGVARLKTSGNNQEFEIHSNKITIMIDNDEAEETVQVIEPSDDDGDATDNNPVEHQKRQGDSEKAKAGGSKRKRAATHADLTFEKKSFATGFYESERIEIVSAYKSLKAKRDEYLLACVRAASPRKVEQELKRIRRERESMQEQETGAEDN